MNDFQALLIHLRQPEYIHVLINPLPLYGMAAGAFTLVMAWIFKSPREQRIGLLWIVFMGIATWFVVRYGIMGYDRVLSMSSSEDAQQWLKVHMNRAEKSMYVFYLTGLVALAALLIPKQKEKLFKVLSAITLLLTVVCLALGGWISHAGGQVRHSEFREGPPSPDQLPKEEHHHDALESMMGLGHEHHHDDGEEGHEHHE